MEGPATDPPPTYTSGAPCFTAGCNEHVICFQYLEKRPGVYCCSKHLVPNARKTENLIHVTCYAKECNNRALYRAHLEATISVPMYVWLCESCVSLKGGTFEDRKVLAINRPIPLLTSTTIIQSPETLASQTEILARIGAADSTPTIDLNNPMYQPLDVTPGQSAFGDVPDRWVISSGSDSPTGDYSTGNRDLLEIPVAKRTRTTKDDTMEQDVTPIDKGVEQLSPLVSEAASTPQLYPPPIPDADKPDLKRKTLSFADAAKGKGKEKEKETEPISDKSPMSTTYCEVNAWDLDVRVPPVTDAPYSFWFDLEETPVNHTALLEYADQHPLIKGLTYRPTGNWVECYTRTAENKHKLLGQKHIVNGTEVATVEARKIAGSRIFMRLANVNPCADDAEIVAEVKKFLSPYGQVERMAPVILRNSKLTSRRWNLIMIVPEGYRLYMEPVFKILGVETLAYWQSQPSVCQHCLIKGHWTSECSPAIRAISFAKKQKRIPPVPITVPEEPQPTLTPPAQPTQQPHQQPTKSIPPIQQPATEGEASKSTAAPPKPVTTPGRGKQGFRFQEAPRPKEAIAPGKGKSGSRLEAALKQSKKVNVAAGFASDTTSSDADADGEESEGFTVQTSVGQKKRDQKESNEKANKRTAAERSPMPAQGQGKKTKTASNRSRTKGTLPDYILFCLCRGYIKDEPIAQQQINDIAPKDFINTIKPSWTSAKYKNFVSWLDRRVKTGKDDSITALEGSWKIKVPDILKPDNPGFIDTSVGIQSDRKKKETEKKGKGKSKEDTNLSSGTEQGGKHPRLAVTVAYQDVDKQALTFVTYIKPNQMISTLRKNIERKIQNQ